MSITETLGTAVKSATYNPEAEKAIAEQKAQAEKAKETFRQKIQALLQEADQLKRTVPPKVTVYYTARLDTLTKEAGKWLGDNPSVSATEIDNYWDGVKQKETSLRTADKQILTIQYTPTYLKAVAVRAFDAKKIDLSKKNKLNDLADSVQAWNKKNLYDLPTNTKLTPEVIGTVFQKFQNEQSIALEGTGEPPLVAPENIKQAETVVKQAEKEVKADKASFNLRRLFSETFSIAGQVIGSLLIIMLFLVSGMLCANDAIGRDYRYRILYFIYGGIGFPIMLIYYLYRWFVGTAPHIYRLLPIYTEEADTSLGRFFLFPFTYVEDEYAKKAPTDFLKQAAAMVGKTYEGSSATTGALKVVEALQGLQVSSQAIAKEGIDAISPALEALQLSENASNIATKLQGLTIKA